MTDDHCSATHGDVGEEMRSESTVRCAAHEMFGRLFNSVMMSVRPPPVASIVSPSAGPYYLLFGFSFFFVSVLACCCCRFMLRFVFPLSPLASSSLSVHSVKKKTKDEPKVGRRALPPPKPHSVFSPDLPPHGVERHTSAPHPPHPPRKERLSLCTTLSDVLEWVDPPVLAKSENQSATILFKLRGG